MTLTQKPRDVFGGLIVMTIGTGFLVYSRALDIGTASRIGPGYFPTILSILIILLGLVIAGLALRSPTTEHSFGQVGAEGPGARKSTLDNLHAMHAPSREENVAGG